MTYQGVFQALADPTRLAIFESLREGPQPVGRLAEGLPVSRPAVSQHLRVLARAGLVRARAEGTRRVYRVDPSGLEELRRWLETGWGDVLRAFETEARRQAASASSRPGRPSRGSRPGRRR